MKLSDLTAGRDNNFNFIRIVAALAVLITHSFVLVVGSGDAEPFRVNLGITMGSIAVDVFFVTSGFLVTASLLNRQSVIDFIIARVLRIFPALIVMLLLTVFGLGIYFTALPKDSYLQNSGTYFYLLKCSTQIFGVAYNLPGVFENNPYKDVVNGSLWSMPHEIRMYAILLITWILLRITGNLKLMTFELSIVSVAVASYALMLVFYFYSLRGSVYIELFFMFFSGACFYVLRKYIVFFRSLLWLLLIALFISSTINKQAFFVIYTLSIAYILFYLAYVPSGKIRNFNNWGGIILMGYIFTHSQFNNQSSRRFLTFRSQR